jgi:hypothetical protein
MTGNTFRRKLPYVQPVAAIRFTFLQSVDTIICNVPAKPAVTPFVKADVIIIPQNHPIPFVKADVMIIPQNHPMLIAFFVLAVVMVLWMKMAIVKDVDRNHTNPQQMSNRLNQERDYTMKRN